MRMRWRPHVLAVLAATLAGLALQGCREEEQGRVLLYDKGSYPGGPGVTEASLADATLNDLRQRARTAY